MIFFILCTWRFFLSNQSAQSTVKTQTHSTEEFICFTYKIGAIAEHGTPLFFLARSNLFIKIFTTPSECKCPHYITITNNPVNYDFLCFCRASIRSIRGQLNYKDFLYKYQSKSDNSITNRIVTNQSHV